MLRTNGADGDAQRSSLALFYERIWSAAAPHVAGAFTDQFRYNNDALSQIAGSGPGRLDPLRGYGRAMLRLARPTGMMEIDVFETAPTGTRHSERASAIDLFPLPGRRGRRSFAELSEQEVLALAISSEEDDARIYLAYADAIRGEYSASAAIFEAMAREEDEHRRRLIDLHVRRFGDRIPLLRREHVSGFYDRRPDWLRPHLPIETVRREAEAMEKQAYAFYLAAAARCEDADTRRLLGDLALAEDSHSSRALELGREYLTPEARELEDEGAHRQFILTWVQPGLAGLMDGSVSTLAPVFAAAFATGDTWQTFLVGLAAALGAGISMGFTEVASDDGVISGRGSPLKRGLSAGVMTTVGGLGHALPYLIPDFWTATATAIIVVFLELWAITWIQHRYMQTPWRRALMQVAFGGALVFAVGMLIGSA